MIRTTAFLSLLAIVAGHPHGPSDFYKKYQSAKNGRVVVEQPFHDVKLASSSDSAANLFFPPLPGQSTVDYHPQRRTPLGDDEAMTYYSWHIHVYFFHEDENVTARALELRDQFISKFSITDCVDDCFMGGPFDTCNTGMCVWDPYYSVDGPHPYGQWGVYLPNELLAQTVSWLTMNHGEFNVLFHPNTGYMVGDHDPSKRAMWISQQVPLDLDFLVWLQCEWFGCSDAVSLAQAKV